MKKLKVGMKIRVLKISGWYAFTRYGVKVGEVYKVEDGPRICTKKWPAGVYFNDGNHSFIYEIVPECLKDLLK